MSASTLERTTASQSFLDALAERAVLFDGAMGTMLYERGVFITQCFEQQNLKKPNLVREVHSAYVTAGAEVIEANTFGANRIKLARFGIDPADLPEIIAAGVQLAREAAGGRAWVAGSIGPAGSRGEGNEPLCPAEAFEVFHEHAELVLAQNVDLVVLETFRELEEMQAALKAVRMVSPDIPVVGLIVPDAKGNLRDGTPCEEVARRLKAMDLAAGGFNDGAGPDGLFELMKKMRQAAPGLNLAALPMIGGAETIEDRTIHLATSEFAAVYARRMQREGVKVLGLCCGSSPAHIKSMRNALRALQPGKLQTGLKGAEVEARSEAIESPWANEPAPTAFGRKLQAGEFAVSVEIDPPVGTDATKALNAARMCRDSGKVDAINIADGPRATARMNPASMAQLLLRDGIEPIIHYCCRDRNLLGMQADLIGANAVGLLNVLLITGDPPKMGDYPDATAVFDVDAIGLARIVSRLNRGEDLAGNPIGDPTRLFPGVGANPGAQDIDHEIDRLRQKCEAGARYILTQPVYDDEIFSRFIDRAAPLGVPILIGILPLASLRNAQFLHNNVPGMAIPRPILDRMEKHPAGEDGRKMGLEIAQEALSLARPMVQGTYIMPPFGSAKAALAVLDALA